MPWLIPQVQTQAEGKRAVHEETDVPRYDSGAAPRPPASSRSWNLTLPSGLWIPSLRLRKAPRGVIDLDDAIWTSASGVSQGLFQAALVGSVVEREEAAAGSWSFSPSS